MSLKAKIRNYLGLSVTDFGDIILDEVESGHKRLAFTFPDGKIRTGYVLEANPDFVRVDFDGSIVVLNPDNIVSFRRD